MSARLFATVALAALVSSAPAAAQTFDSGSDGSDGALTFAPNLGQVILDPRALVPPRDVDGDNVYHFTTITIGVGTQLRLLDRFFPEGRPVVWLASGEVRIEGTLDLNGYDVGGSSPGGAGAGGWRGGRGVGPGQPPLPGNGPGGGGAGDATTPRGGPAGHVLTVVPSSGQASAGASYGNEFLVPLAGGSGGGGSTVGNNNNTGGGGGGGAIVIASSVSIYLRGTIVARGETAESPGSGGAVRLVAPVLEGGGSVDARGGNGVFLGQVGAGPGRVRLERFRELGAQPLATFPEATRAPCGPVFPPASAPTLRVARVAGVDVAASPTGSFEVPDAVVDAVGPVQLELEARSVPAGTSLTVRVEPATGAAFNVTSTPLVAGATPTDALTASASVTLPSGHVRLFVTASWTP